MPSSSSSRPAAASAGAAAAPGSSRRSNRRKEEEKRAAGATAAAATGGEGRGVGVGSARDDDGDEYEDEGDGGGDGGGGGYRCYNRGDGTDEEFPFSIFGKRFTIGQLPSDQSIGHGAVVWEAAVIFAKYMEFTNSKQLTVGALSGKTVLELGSGTGLGGMCMCLRGARVTLTDLPCVVDLITLANVRHVYRQLCSQDTGGDGVLNAHLLRPAVYAVDWTETDNIDRLVRDARPIPVPREEEENEEGDTDADKGGEIGNSADRPTTEEAEAGSGSGSGALVSRERVHALVEAGAGVGVDLEGEVAKLRIGGQGRNKDEDAAAGTHHPPPPPPAAMATAPPDTKHPTITTGDCSDGDGDDLRITLPFDIVLLTDCVFSAKLVPSLIRTIQAASGPRTTVYCVHEIRDVEANTAFVAALKVGHKVKTIPMREQHPDYRHEQVQLLVAKPLRSSAKRKGGAAAAGEAEAEAEAEDADCD